MDEEEPWSTKDRSRTGRGRSHSGAAGGTRKGTVRNYLEMRQGNQIQIREDEKELELDEEMDNNSDYIQLVDRYLGK